MLVAGELLSDATGAGAGLRLDLAGWRLRLASTGLDVGGWTALRQRFGDFVAADDGDADVELTLEAADAFATALDRGATVQVSVSGDEVHLAGAARGVYRPAQRRGRVHADGVGAVDALVRLALWSQLARGEGLLAHAALLPDGAGGASVVAGASGAGKSTLARAFAAPCDEMVALRRGADGWRAWSTPYWGATPLSLPLGRVVLLARAGEAEAPRVEAVRGAAAVRLCWPHVLRYAASPALEGEQLARLAQLAGEIEVVRACCPSGAAFLPFVQTHQIIQRRA